MILGQKDRSRQNGGLGFTSLKVSAETGNGTYVKRKEDNSSQFYKTTAVLPEVNGGTKGNHFKAIALRLSKTESRKICQPVDQRLSAENNRERFFKQY